MIGSWGWDILRKIGLMVGELISYLFISVILSVLYFTVKFSTFKNDSSYER